MSLHIGFKAGRTRFEYWASGQYSHCIWPRRPKIWPRRPGAYMDMRCASNIFKCDYKSGNYTVQNSTCQWPCCRITKDQLSITRCVQQELLSTNKSPYRTLAQWEGSLLSPDGQIRLNRNKPTDVCPALKQGEKRQKWEIQ